MRFVPTQTRVACAWFVATLALTPLASLAESQIHRCTEGGRVMYTDRGCPALGEVVAVATLSPVSANARYDAVTRSRDTLVTLGMSPRSVLDAMGRPLETIATLQGRALVEYWLYRNADGTTRVAFQEGRVTRIDSR